MSINESLDWYDSLENDVGYACERNKNDFAVLINTLMMEQGISKADLSRLTRKSAPYVTKVLRGDANLTISSMTKLLDAIDCNLHITGCRKEHEIKSFKIISNGQSMGMTPAQKDATSIWVKQANYDQQAA